MSIPGPVGKDNLLISFRLQSKTHLFDGSTNALNNARVDLVASASTHGLVFVGSTNPELFVICTKDLELPTAINQNSPVRRITLPSPIKHMATNCDGSILAVDTKINGVPHIQLYSISSFLNPNVQKISEFRVSSDNSGSVQLCWNPCLAGVLAVCTENGALNVYSIKEQGFNLSTIDPSLKAKCCCWSPKGKQIVAGFANGKLIQFTTELKPARTIECPANVFPGGNFDVITVQWLSNYQFAVAFLSHQRESRPILHILNAPKAGPPQFISYNDVCYSTTETRPSKMYIQYIQAWGMLLVASSNCIDISFLKVSKPGDIPEWTQEFPNDQFPAELPLTPEKDESFVCGFEMDTSCANKLVQEDGNLFPVMPMIHLVSTYGILCSFYVVNATQSYVDICSPPRPNDARVQSLFAVHNVPVASSKGSTDESTFSTPLKTETAPISHSTPSVPKTNLFGAISTTTPFSLTSQSQPNAFSGFSITQQTKPQQQPATTGFSMLGTKPVATAQPSIQSQLPNVSVTQTVTVPQNKTLLATPVAPANQPLITIPPIYNPQTTQQKPESIMENLSNEKLSEAEDEQIYVKMIQDEIKGFELELSFLMDKSRSLTVDIGTKEESAGMRKKLEELDELKKEATETIESLKSDVQTNRLGLTEMFSMVYEAKAKCSLANNEKSLIMSHNQIQDRSMKRTLDALKKMISQCEMQINVVVQLLNSQWANYQDTVGKNKKNRIHVPSLEGVYQTLTKQQEIIYNLSAKLKLLKSKLGICDDVKKQSKNVNTNATIESLSDSIISMSLIDQVRNEKSKLTEKKQKNLLNYLENREVVTVKPHRPHLTGLNSEIIIEKKIKAMKSLKKSEPKKKLEPQQPPLQKEPKPLNQQAKNDSKPQPAVTAFDNTSSIQKSPVFTPVPSTTNNSQPQIPMGKKDDVPKSNLFSFDKSTQPNFGINLGASQPLNLNTSLPPPNFGSGGFLSSKLVSKVEKKQEEVKNDVKPASTISNANISVSANFSFSLPAKPSDKLPKEPAKAEDNKNVEEQKSLTSNESTTFTFSLPNKKESAPGQPTSKSSSVITFGNAPSTAVSDTVKNAFSFGFNTQKEGKTPLGFVDSSKSNIFASPTSAQVVPKVSCEDSKSPSSISATDATSTSTSSIFGTKITTADTKSSFSFASFGSSVPATQIGSVSSSAPLESSVFSSKTETTTVTTASERSPIVPPQSTDSVLDGLKICSPTVASISSATTTPNTSIVSSSLPKTDTASIFGSNSFAAASTPNSSSIFSGSIVTTTVASQPFSATTTTQSTSIFAQPATAIQTTSAFGSLDLANKASSPSSTTSVFGSGLVKPDQSVFGQPAVTSSTAPTNGAFGNIFSAAVASSDPKTSNVFATPHSSNVFGSAPTSIFSQSSAGSQGSIFGQTATTSAGSIFGQTTTTTVAPSAGSIFSQSTFSSPPAAPSTGSIFGGSATSTQSPFGTSSVFGTQQSTSSIFGGSNTFGAQTNNPTTNIFGGSAGNVTTSPFGSSNIFAQGQNAPTFGGNATFSSTLGQSSFGSTGGSIFSQQQNQPVFGGGASFGIPKANIFGATQASPPAAQSGNIFEQLGSQQTGNLFGSLAQTSPPQPQAQQTGFSGSAFSSWR